MLQPRVTALPSLVALRRLAMVDGVLSRAVRMYVWARLPLSWVWRKGTAESGPNSVSLFGEPPARFPHSSARAFQLLRTLC